MKVISTNLGAPTTFIWNGKEEQTGIFKKPISEPLYLTKGCFKRYGNRPHTSCGH